MRFHFDEHIHNGLAAALRTRGHDVSTPMEVGLLEASDSLHIEFALNDGRVIVTHDRDFLMKDAEGIEHGGILYCHQQKYSVGELLNMCLLVAESYSQEEMRGRVEFL
jgi:predicted nuclease of predicted toxin-antitoxin system